MTEDVAELSRVLTELADLKSELDGKKKTLIRMRSIINNNNADKVWCDAVSAKTDADYLQFESKKLTDVKTRYLNKLFEVQNHIDNKPEPKEVKHTTSIFGFIFVPIIVTVFFLAIFIYVGINVSWFGYLIAAVYSVIMIVVLVFIYVLSPWAKKYRDAKSQNKANEDFNKNTYPRLCIEYREKLQRAQSECEKLRADVLAAINESIASVKASERCVVDEISRLTREIDGGKFSIYSVREYSAEQLKSMSDYLIDGRADNYKEALNLYLQEAAEQRHREELMRLERERAAAEAAHKKEMTALKKQAEEAESVAKTAKQTAETARKQAQAVQKKFEDRCRACKKYYSCSKKNCTGYIPK